MFLTLERKTKMHAASIRCLYYLIKRNVNIGILGKENTKIMFGIHRPFLNIWSTWSSMHILKGPTELTAGTTYMLIVPILLNGIRSMDSLEKYILIIIVYSIVSKHRHNRFMSMYPKDIFTIEKFYFKNCVNRKTVADQILEYFNPTIIQNSSYRNRIARPVKSIFFNI